MTLLEIPAHNLHPPVPPPNLVVAEVVEVEVEVVEAEAEEEVAEVEEVIMVVVPKYVPLQL